MNKIMKVFNKSIKIKILILCLLLIIGIAIGYSFAFFLSSDDIDNNIATSACFKLTFEDKDEINLDKTYPLSEEEGSALTPYEFKIKNVCNGAAEYQVNIETLNNSTLDTNYIRSKLDDNNTNIIGNLEEVTTYVNENVSESRKLAEGLLLKDEEVTYKLRLWVDEASTVEQSADKIYEGKVVVQATQNKNPYKELTLNANGGEVSPTKVQVVERRVVGVLPTPIREGHTFNGWFDKEENGNQVTESTIINEDKEIYAYWNKNIYELSVNPNEGTWEGYTSEQRYNIGYKETKEIANPTRIGYHFTNWTLTGSGSTIENNQIRGTPVK